MTMTRPLTRLEDLKSPDIISEETVQENMQRLNKIKLELQKSNEERKTSMINIVENEMSIESEMMGVLNPMHAYYESSVLLSKKEKELMDEITLFNTFFTENKALLGSKKYNEYSLKIKSISANFVEVQTLKNELDNAYQLISPQLDKLISLYNAIEKNHELINPIYIEVKTASIERKKQNIARLENNIEKRNEDITKEQNGIIKRNEKIQELKADNEKKLAEINKRFDEVIIEKKHHAKSASSTPHKHTKRKAEDKPGSTMKTKKVSQTIKETVIVPDLAFESLVNDSKTQHDKQKSLAYPYKMAADSYSYMIDSYNFFDETVNKFTTTYKNLTERREQARLNQQKTNTTVSPQARQQHAMFQPAEKAVSVLTQEIQKQTTYTQGMK